MMLKVGTIKSLPPANYGLHDALCVDKKKTLRGADESTTLLLNSWINHLGSTCNKR